MKIKELREISNPDLLIKEKELKKELFGLNFQKRTATVEKPGRFRDIRRTIAKIFTIIKERELHEERIRQKGK